MSTQFMGRVYPLNSRDLTEEQIAVTFAMTSRSPEAFDEIARRVSEEKAADFHERWVVGYGHASVAEHAVVHMAVENISRIACDGLEDNRLASYTEKSSRYQVIDKDSFYVPLELDSKPTLRENYIKTCRYLFNCYQKLLDGSINYLQSLYQRRDNETQAAYNLRIRRIATDACRSVLPAGILTNVGVTANARTLEHAISKLLSSELREEQTLGEIIKAKGREIAPTLIKYANAVPYLQKNNNTHNHFSEFMQQNVPNEELNEAWLVHWDENAVIKLAAALLYRVANTGYENVWQTIQMMPPENVQQVIDEALDGIGPHDAPPREFEVVDYTFEFMLDYGAFREFRRHRMQTYLPQPLSTNMGYRIPNLITEAYLVDEFIGAMETSEIMYTQIAEAISPLVAQYIVTHAHHRLVTTKLNLRECYHMFKLRTSPMAHESIRGPMLQALELVTAVHPELFEQLQLRD